MADEIQTPRQAVARAVACSESCRATVQRLRDRAYEQFGRRAITLADYNQVDARCNAALQSALKMVDAAAHALGPEIESALAPIAAATDQLAAASDGIEKAGAVVALSASLLESVLAVAAAVVDPTHASVLAAVGSVQSTIAAIIKQSAKGDDAATSDGADPSNSDATGDGTDTGKVNS